MEEASWLQENDNNENSSIAEERDIILTQRNTIENVKRVVTNVMQTLKRKEEDSKASMPYFTSQL